MPVYGRNGLGKLAAGERVGPVIDRLPPLLARSGDSANLPIIPLETLYEVGQGGISVANQAISKLE